MMKIALFMALALCHGVLCQYPSIYEAYNPWMVYWQGMNNVNYQLAKQNAAAWGAVNNAYRDAMHTQYGHYQNSGVTGNLGYAPVQPTQTPQPQQPTQTPQPTQPTTTPQQPAPTPQQPTPTPQQPTPTPQQPTPTPQQPTPTPQQPTPTPQQPTTTPEQPTPPTTTPEQPTQPQQPAAPQLPTNPLDPTNNPLAPLNPLNRKRRQAPAEMGVTWADYWAPYQQSQLVAWDQWFKYLDTANKAYYHTMEGAQQGNNQYFQSLANSGQFGLAGRAANAPGATPALTEGGIPTNIDGAPSATDSAANALAGQAFQPRPYVNARR